MCPVLTPADLSVLSFPIGHGTGREEFYPVR